jgi:hypothetical protein
MPLARASISVLLIVFAAEQAAVAQEPSLQDILKRAAIYVADFQRQLSGIVAEERYDQQIKNSSSTTFETRRRLRSDFLLVRPVDSDRYVEFRDVFEVDGRAVRDREDRLTKLFIDPPPGARSQIQGVVEESARYNIGNIVRTLNTPVLPLSFLLPQYQERFVFKLARNRMPPILLERQSGSDRGSSADIARDVRIVEYDERERPTLIRSLRDANLPARGRFWIDAGTGAVLMSELIVEVSDLTATVDVRYQEQPQIAFLVPAEMRELYRARRDHIEGRATYGRFRKFQVLVDEAIKPIKK